MRVSAGTRGYPRVNKFNCTAGTGGSGYDIEYGGYPRVNKTIGPAGAGII